VKAGQIVKVQVLSVDVKGKRISLSKKALEAPPPRPPGGKPQPRPAPSLEDKLNALSAKWKVR
jgi:uncharacterized protein